MVITGASRGKGLATMHDFFRIGVWINYAGMNLARPFTMRGFHGVTTDFK
jgi:hypothetical protein